MNWTLLENSLALSALATAGAALPGFAVAVFVAGLEPPWRTVVIAFSAVALALPPFVVANCWLGLLGHTGTWRGWFPFELYSIAGAGWILALLLWPILTLATLAAWRRLQSSHLETEPELQGLRLTRWLLIPSALPLITPALGLIFVLALNNFAIPALLQVKVFPAELWLRYSTTFNYVEAAKLSWPMLLVPAVLLAFFCRKETTWPRTEGDLVAKELRGRFGKPLWWSCGAATVLLLLLAVVLPASQLLFNQRTWIELPAAFAASRATFLNSFIFSTGAAASTVAVGWCLSRFNAGWIFYLLWLYPGIGLGILLIWGFNRPPLIAIYQSLAIVWLAFTLRYLAIGWHGMRLARAGMDRELTDAARLAGASGWPLFRAVFWPQTAPQLAATAYVVYLLSLWDVESLLLIVPPGGETLALRIFNLLHYGHNAQVNALCILLLLLAIAPLLLWRGGILLFHRFGKSIQARDGRTRSLFGCGFDKCQIVRLYRCASRAVPLLPLPLLLLTGCGQAPDSSLSLQSALFSRVEVIGTRGTAPGQFNKPRSVAVDAADNLYVVDITGRVQKFDATGKYLLSWQMPETDLGKPKGMGIDAKGRIVVIEPHYSRVNHFTPEGKLELQWGSHGTNAGQLAFPRSVAINSRGNLFVSEYGSIERIQWFSPDGSKLLGAIHSTDKELQLNRAEGVWIDSQDRLFVADSCNHRILVFDSTGGWIRAHGRAGQGKGELSYPYDIRTDRDGYQFVCEFGNSRVQVFDGQDQPVEIIGRTGGAPGEFSNPWSLALDSAGNLYVADGGNNRVQKFIRRVPQRDARPRPA